MFYRILIAVIVVVALGLLIPALFRVLGFPVSGDVIMIIRICIAAIALLYILTGNKYFPNSSTP